MATRSLKKATGHKMFRLAKQMQNNQKEVVGQNSINVKKNSRSGKATFQI